MCMYISRCLLNEWYKTITDSIRYTQNMIHAKCKSCVRWFCYPFFHVYVLSVPYPVKSLTYWFLQRHPHTNIGRRFTRTTWLIGCTDFVKRWWFPRNSGGNNCFHGLRKTSAKKTAERRRIGIAVKVWYWFTDKFVSVYREGWSFIFAEQLHPNVTQGGSKDKSNIMEKDYFLSYITRIIERPRQILFDIYVYNSMSFCCWLCECLYSAKCCC